MPFFLLPLMVLSAIFPRNDINPFPAVRLPKRTGKQGSLYFLEVSCCSSSIQSPELIVKPFHLCHGQVMTMVYVAGHRESYKEDRNKMSKPVQVSVCEMRTLTTSSGIQKKETLSRKYNVNKVYTLQPHIGLSHSQLYTPTYHNFLYYHLHYHHYCHHHYCYPPNHLFFPLLASFEQVLKRSWYLLQSFVILTHAANKKICYIFFWHSF
uniref:Secreted protein n=1 Tax=Octopus bimaculoides TaxID=37653 RepID=A0A0L8GAB8_OCTBM